jgi:hypothetical protein
MKYPWVGSVVVTVAVGALLWRADTQIAGQGQPHTSSLVAHTPWGDPDLQGIWDLKTRTPLERPQKYAGREFLTDEEVAALEREAEFTRELNARQAGGYKPGEPRAARGSQLDVYQAYNHVFLGSTTKFVRTKRTALVIDPAVGRIPYSSEGRKRLEADAAFRKLVDDDDLTGSPTRATGPEDRPTDRCPGFVLPCIRDQCGISRIVQAPGSVTIYYENGHAGGAYRFIPLDGRPHLPSHIRQWYGDSVGRWEGDTLVVDTVNFKDWSTSSLTSTPMGFRGNGEQFHIVERFTRTAPEMILYTATLENPTLYTRPWTLELPWIQLDEKKNQIYESACHEGNHGLTGILAGARAAEKRPPREPRH